MNVLKAFNNNEYTTNGLKVFDGENWVSAGFNITQNIEVGEELNFSVVGGTTEPTNPTENMIWVNTDIAISEWVFSAEQPTNPTAGMVWFNVDKVSSTPINALKQNGLYVYPTGCMQYIDSTWANKEVLLFQNSSWNSIRPLVIVLYDAGTVNTDLVGSFKSIGKKTVEGGSGGSATAPSVTYASDHIQLSNYASYQGGIFYTENMIDLTLYNQVYLKCSYSGLYIPSLKIYSAMPDYQNSNVVATISFDNATDGVITLDVSALSGSYYIAIAQMSATQTIFSYIYKLWCE